MLNGTTTLRVTNTWYGYRLIVLSNEPIWVTTGLLLAAQYFHMKKFMSLSKQPSLKVLTLKSKLLITPSLWYWMPVKVESNYITIEYEWILPCMWFDGDVVDNQYTIINLYYINLLLAICINIV